MADCHTGKDIEVDPEGRTRDIMNSFWSSLTGDDIKFWNHEYNKHGYCFTERTGAKNEQPFFDAAVSVYEDWRFDQLMIHAVGDVRIANSDEISFTYDQLAKIINDARPGVFFSIKCTSHEKKEYLSEVHFFFDINLKPLDHEQGTSCGKDKKIYVSFDN
jgi:hypothetical protein